MTENGKSLRLRYDEGCLGAHALNTIGDRWALLVVRELMFAPKRFQMIRAGLPGITATVLTKRLGQLVDAGLVDHDSVLGIYRLTVLGHALHPVLTELCRWALILPGHDPTRFISLTALMISISATVDSQRSASLPLRAGFVSGNEAFEVGFARDGAPQVRAVRQPQADFVATGSGNMLARMIYCPQPPQNLMVEGAVDLHGDIAAAQVFMSLFSLKPQV